MRTQGEGRAAAASRTPHLGETLPPINLAFYDQLGNQVPASSAANEPTCELGPSAVRLEVLTSSMDAGGTVLQEVTVSADVQPHDGCLRINDLRICGPDVGGPMPNGMRLFAEAAEGEADAVSAAPFTRLSAFR